MISGAAGTEVFLPPFASGSQETPQPSVHSRPGQSDLPTVLSLLSSEEYGHRLTDPQEEQTPARDNNTN